MVEAASELELTQTQVEPAQPPKDDGKIRSLWRNRDFMLLWGGQSVSVLGGTMSQITFPLLMLAITGSPLAAGIAGALYSIPYIIFSLPAGALIDRWDRKLVMILCDTGRAINMATIPIAAATNSLTEWQLYINAFVEGSFFVWFNIAEVSALPRVVARSNCPMPRPRTR